jgi:hypothetical protein
MHFNCFINKSSLISRISINKRFDERDVERNDSGKSRDETRDVAPTRKALDLSHTSRGVTNGRRESMEPMINKKQV